VTGLFHQRLPWPLVFQVLGVIAAVAFLIATWQLCLLAFTGLILAAAMLPAARVGARYRVPRGVTVLVVYVAVAVMLVLMGRLLWPALTEQWTHGIHNLGGKVGGAGEPDLKPAIPKVMGPDKHHRTMRCQCVPPRLNTRILNVLRELRE